MRCQVNELKHVKLCNDPLKYLNMKNNKKTEVFFLKLWNKKHHFSFHVSYLCLISFMFKENWRDVVCKLISACSLSDHHILYTSSRACSSYRDLLLSALKQLLGDSPLHGWMHVG